MAKYIDAEKLIAEIERRMEDYNASIEKYYGKEKSIKAERDSWKWAECKWFLNLIASLQQEQPGKELDVTDFCKPVDPNIAQCVADHWWEMLDGKDAEEEQPEVDLDEEIEKELRLHYNDDQDVYWWNYLKNSFHHFYKLGRKQVLQEIYDGKTKPVDKITAAWLDD